MPKPPRIFISPEDLRGAEAVITGSDVRHIRTVLRKQPGDLLTLLNGRGEEYQARIIRIDPLRIIAEIEGKALVARRGPAVLLGQGLAKSDRMDWVVQKATELGVSSVVPLATERTIVKVRDEAKRISRWQAIARQAAMQCGRPDLPEIGFIRPFGAFVSSLDRAPRTLLLMPWEEGAAPVRAELRAHRDADRIVVLIGPEGGFSADEVRLAEAGGFRAVTLGPNVLRTETAAVAVLSMILYEMGGGA